MADGGLGAVYNERLSPAWEDHAPGQHPNFATMLKHLLSGWLLVLGLCRLSAADKTTTINASSNWGTWEGWGTSLAWWAAAFGDRDDLADIFFSLKSTGLNGQTVSHVWCFPSSF